MKKKGAILIENVVFIILNILFLAVLILFLVKQGSGAIVLEQSYSKQIALLIDSAKPVMLLKIDMEKGKKLAEKNGIDFNDVVNINGNIVKVKLSEKGGYEYAFFNDIEATAYPDTDDKNGYIYVITITKKEIKNE